MTINQVLVIVCGSWIIFMLGFCVAALLAAAKRGDGPTCGCGKTAKEHAPGLLNLHHYWYIHKESMPECSVCENVKAMR